MVQRAAGRSALSSGAHPPVRTTKGGRAPIVCACATSYANALIVGIVWAAVRVAAFDSKPFNRGSIVKAHGEEGVEKYVGYSTQLGIGAIVPDVDAFTSAFVAEFASIKDEFGISTSLPFMPANGLLKFRSRRKAVAVAEKIIRSIGGMIEGVHCSFVALPTKTYETVPVGGGGGSAHSLPTRSFIDSLGPMFSYLTAQSYAHAAGKAAENAEIRIDSFVSKRTRAWDSLEKRNPKVYWRGDECDAVIACADLLAFLTDSKLYSSYLKLEPDNIKEVWKSYPFDISVGVYGHGNLWNYAWYSNEMINVRPYIAKPTVFLSIDDLADPAPDSDPEDADDENGKGSGTAVQGKKRAAFHHGIKQSDAYSAAVRMAFKLSGSLKIFKIGEDTHSVLDKDVFVYIGERSKRVGKALQDSVDVTVMSGLELRRSIKATN